jgi:hypothetical protein
MRGRDHTSWHDRAFDDTATKVMGIAFDAVCEKMDGLACSDVVKEIIATVASSVKNLFAAQ